MSTVNVYHGNSDKAVLQTQGASVLDSGMTPAATRIKFDELTADRNPIRSPNNTIQNQTVQAKMDEMDEEPTGTITGAFCLNDIGIWLKHHCGAPVTTGSGPYTHVFTFGFDERPTFLMDLEKPRSGGSSLRRRMLGGLLNQMSWDPMAQKQQWQGQLMFAQESLPAPVASWDATAAFLAYAIAATHKAQITDGGSNVLGDVSSLNITSSLNASGKHLANGERGYGQYVIGDEQLLSAGGSIVALFEDDSLWETARSNASTALQVVSATADGSASLTCLYPAIGFSKEAAWQSTLSSGAKMISLDWYAHHLEGAEITYTLVNGVPSY